MIPCDIVLTCVQQSYRLCWFFEDGAVICSGNLQCVSAFFAVYLLKDLNSFVLLRSVSSCVTVVSKIIGVPKTSTEDRDGCCHIKASFCGFFVVLSAQTLI